MAYINLRKILQVIKNEASEKAEAALYKLGKYDSAVDNGNGTITITRQTGYLSRGDILGFNLISGRNFYVKFNLSYFALSYSNIITNVASCYNCYNDGGYIQCNFTSYTDIPDLTTLTSLLKNFSMQYKLASSYTQKAISNAYNPDYVLLWENGSPTSTQASATLSSLPDMSKFKYIVFETKRAADNSSYKIFKIPYAINNFGEFGFAVYSRYLYTRAVKILSATSIEIRDGYFGDISGGTNSGDNNVCIITKIYGTNVL